MTPYIYRVLEVIKVHDGDTVELRIDLGFRMTIVRQCRLYGINAAELKDDVVQAEAARHRLAELLMDGPILCKTYRDATEKYGRLLVGLINNSEVCINEAMVREGYAKQYV